MIDPLDALRSGATPVEPDPAFRARLMAEVRASLTAPSAAPGPPSEEVSTSLLEIKVNDRPDRASNARRIALLSVAAAIIIGLVLVVTLRDDSDPPAAPVTTSEPSTSVAPTTVAPPLDDDGIAQAALLVGDDVGGGYLTQPGETFLNSTTLGADLPECATWKDSVFTPLASATRRAQLFFKQIGAQFEQASWVFPDVDQATAVMDGMAAPEYAACDLAVNIAAVNEASCCEQADLAAADPPTITPDGDQQVVRSVSGTFVSGGQQASVQNTIVYTRVGRVITVFSVPNGLDPPDGPGGPDATIEEMVAASIARLDGAPIR